MLRALALCLLTALPAAAQDFRGLRPGMHASALGPIGEASTVDYVNGLTRSSYPLPYAQGLVVVYDDAGVIQRLSSASLPFGSGAPETGGLQINEMTLGEVMDRLGRDAPDLDTPGLVAPHTFDGRVTLVFDHASDPDLLVILSFDLPVRGSLSDPQPDVPPIPEDALLTSAILSLRAHFEGLGLDLTYLGGRRNAPIPFPLTIDEAFPSLIP